MEIKKTSAIIAAIAFILSAQTLTRNQAWRSETSLWSDISFLSPGKARPRYNLGTIYHRHGDIDSAIKEYKKAVGIDPSFYLALNNLGYAYFKKGLFKEAINEYKKALEFSPKDPDVRYNLAMAYAATGLKKKAREEFLLVLSIIPGDPDTTRELAKITGRSTVK